MSSAPLNTLDATELATRLARRELSAEALMRDCLAHINLREPGVQAFVHLDASAALAEARRLDAGAVRGPLHGLPIGMKDVFDTRDMPSRYGSPIHAQHRPDADAAVVALCHEAGAVLAGKTVTTEFATYQPGPTRNPHQLDHTPGGSSSGSAAAVADHMLPLATGTQTAGSIVRPAAYCGVVGFKPSYGRVSRSGLKMISESLDTVGGFARSVPDVALLISVLAGDPGLRASANLDHAPRVGLFIGPDHALLDDASRALWARVAARLEALGARPSPVAAPANFAALGRMQSELMQSEMARSLAHERLNHPQGLSARLSGMLQAGLAVSGEQHVAMLADVQQARQSAGALFQDHDLLLAPSATGEAGLAVDGTGDPVFCRAWTLMGLPCLHLPLGTGPRGLPIGLQLIGPALADARLLQAGAWLHPRLRD